MDDQALPYQLLKLSSMDYVDKQAKDKGLERMFEYELFTLASSKQQAARSQNHLDAEIALKYERELLEKICNTPTKLEQQAFG